MRTTVFLLLLFFQLESYALSLTLSPSSIGCGTSTVTGTFDCAFTGTIVLNVSGGVELDAATSIVSVSNGSFNIDLIVQGSDSSPFNISGVVIASNLSCAVVNTNYSKSMTHSCVLPDNDECSDAKVLVIGDLICNYTSTDTDNTQSSTVPTCGGAGYVDLWYEFDCQGSEITLELGTFPGNVIYYAMFEENCGGTQVACGLLTTFGSNFVTVTGLTDGLIYKIQILHITSASGPEQEVCIYTDLAAAGSLALQDNSLDIEFRKNQVDLKWQDDSKPGDYFEIYRKSQKNDVYDIIATIDAFDIGQLDYGFSDDDLALGQKYYYNVRKFNYSGREIYSMQNSIFLKSNKSENRNMLEMHVWPNPSNGEFSISLLNDQREEADVSIYDQQGRRLYTFKKTLEAGVNIFKLPVNTFGTGLFSLEITTARTQASKRLQVIN